MAGQNSEEARIVLSLLEAVERDSHQSQRRLASEFGIAVGLVNAYLKRCVKKGLVKVRAAPARRYTYYLTPQGFAEKSRLTIEYLYYSLSFFRRARADCTATLQNAQRRGWKRVALAGISDLAEISTICAMETGISIVGMIDQGSHPRSFLGLPVFSTVSNVLEPFDGVIVTDVSTAYQTFEAISCELGRDRVLAPALLGLSTKAYADTVI